MACLVSTKIGITYIVKTNFEERHNVHLNTHFSFKDFPEKSGEVLWTSMSPYDDKTRDTLSSIASHLKGVGSWEKQFFGGKKHKKQQV